MQKDFEQWIALKKQLDQLHTQPPYVKEGDIWWVSIGENVGVEVSGKSRLFSRPAIILKKLSDKHYLIVPASSKQKEGTWYVPFLQKGIANVACLHQVRTIDYRRLSSKLGSLDEQDFLRVHQDFQALYYVKKPLQK